MANNTSNIAETNIGITGEIKMYAGKHLPLGWAVCNGQRLTMTEYGALYAVIGNTYGGDGRTYFNLPNLSGRILIGTGRGKGAATAYNLGDIGGQTEVTLTPTQMPSHNHNYVVSTANAKPPANKFPYPTGCLLAAPALGGDSANDDDEMVLYLPDSTPGIQPLPLAENTIESTGGNRSHNNMQPYVTINYIICLSGTMPSFS